MHSSVTPAEEFLLHLLLVAAFAVDNLGPLRRITGFEFIGAAGVHAGAVPKFARVSERKAFLPTAGKAVIWHGNAKFFIQNQFIFGNFKSFRAHRIFLDCFWV